MPRIEMITSWRRLAQIREEWEAVLAASNCATYTLAPGWFLAWAGTLGRGHEPAVLRVRRGREAIAFVPLMFGRAGRESFLSYRTLYSMPDSNLASTKDLIVARERERVIPKVLRYLTRRTICSELEFTKVPEYSPNLEYLREFAAEHRDRCAIVEWIDLYRIAIGSRPWEEYLQTTSKSFVRKDIARLRNRYAEHDWAIREFGADRLEELLPTLARLHAESQERHGRSSSYRNDEYLEMLRRAARDPSFGPSFRIFVLEVDGETAAFELGFHYNGSFYGRDTGYDGRFARLSPSKFLMYKVLERGFQERWQYYDQGGGSSHYKQHWGCERYSLYGIKLSNGLGLGKALKRLRRRPWSMIGRRKVLSG